MQHAGAAKAPPKATGHIDPQRTAYALALNPSTQTSIRNAGIDEALEAEGRHPERERVLRDQVLSALKDDPSGQQLQVTCGETICRLDIEKPGNEGLRWHEIDDAIHSVAKGGELIFNAEPVGERAVAAVYLAVADTTLPVDYEDPEEQD
jgi:hypothetical protein